MVTYKMTLQQFYAFTVRYTYNVPKSVIFQAYNERICTKLENMSDYLWIEPLRTSIYANITFQYFPSAALSSSAKVSPLAGEMYELNSF